VASQVPLDRRADQPASFQKRQFPLVSPLTSAFHRGQTEGFHVAGGVAEGRFFRGGCPSPKARSTTRRRTRASGRLRKTPGLRRPTGPIERLNGSLAPRPGHCEPFSEADP